MVTRTPNPRPAATASGSADRGEDPRGEHRLSDTWRGLRAAWRRIERGIPELKDDALCYASAKADRARLALSDAARSLVRGVVLGIVGVAIVVVAAVLVIDGIAGGLAAALDGNTWLANLLTGVAIVTSALVLTARRDRRKATARLQRLAARYARHDARQRAMEARGVS